MKLITKGLGGKAGYLIVKGMLLFGLIIRGTREILRFAVNIYNKIEVKIKW